MSATALKNQAFKLKGRLYTLTVIQLQVVDLEAIEADILRMQVQAPNLFKAAPVVIDCTLLSDELIDIAKVIECFRRHELIPVAIHHHNPAVLLVASHMGVGVLNASSTRDRALEIEPTKKSRADKVSLPKTKMVSQPIRSGQQVFAKQSDLIVTAAVSAGAELLADGNIHVYGALRGRALAGMSGDKDARIFCQSLDAELVSIAGFYRLSDNMAPMQGPLQIFLKDEQIEIAPLC